jgi:hypothetical protein
MIDERYVLHRFKATSHAAMVGAFMLGGFFLYDFLAHDVLRWDVAIVLAAMAITKLGALVYYRRFD